jgi:MFS family permease
MPSSSNTTYSRTLLLLFSANIISGLSQGISILAIPWYFTSIRDKASLFGVIYMSINVVSLFWGLYAGVLIDRYDRKKIFMALSAVGSVLAFIVAGLGFYHGEVPDWAAAMAFASTVFIFNVHYPNLYRFVAFLGIHNNRLYTRPLH